jgi:hypothetical protein
LLGAKLTAAEREFADLLLYASPNYRYELSGLPRLDPAPGVPSAIAAAKAIIAWRKSRQKKTAARGEMESRRNFQARRRPG